MNKSELIDAIAKHADISKAAAGRALDATVNSIRVRSRKTTSSLVGFSSFVGKRTADGPQSAPVLRSRSRAKVPKFGLASSQGFGKLTGFPRAGSLIWIGNKRGN